MIPLTIIEIATRGGWIPTDIMNTGNYIADTKYRDCTAVLDPLFWQALGKELGLGLVKEHCSHYYPYSQKNCTVCKTKLDSRHNKKAGDDWRRTALRFYDLILTGGNTEKFWQELLDNE